MHDWVSNKGTKIPIEKNTLYNLLRIGYIQWFMKEDFKLVTVPTEQIAEFYQKEQFSEFKEPVYVNLTHTFTHKGNVPTSIAGAKELINVEVKTEFSAINTSGINNKEDRYINRNGILASLKMDVFESVPRTPQEIDDYLKRISLSLTFDDSDSQPKVFQVQYVPADYSTHLRGIKKKNVDQIANLVKDLTGKEVDMKELRIYVLYHFFDRKDPEISGFYYIIFCPFPIESQKSWCIKLARTHSFAQNDYFHNTLSSLTRVLVVHLQGFESTHRTMISEMLQRHDSDIKVEYNILQSGSIILPRSSFIVSWQKK